MTEVPEEEEAVLIEQILRMHPDEIVSLVGDTRTIKGFVVDIIGTKLKDLVVKRKLPVVIRPDSITPDLNTPAIQMGWILDQLVQKFGCTYTDKGYKLLPSYVRVLWGDGIGLDGVEAILDALADNGFAAGNIACFGMGGGLLQKHNRDTQRMAFKASAFERGGKWHDMKKTPLDVSKTSKAGRLKLVKNEDGEFETVTLDDPREDQLVTVFENGELKVFYTLEEIRARVNA
jgi:nicotinamide phosphoribosyltransferase